MSKKYLLASTAYWMSLPLNDGEGSGEGLTPEQITQLQQELEATKAKLDKANGDAGKFRRIAEKFDGVDLTEIETLRAKAGEFEGIDKKLIDAAKAMATAAQTEEDKALLEQRGLEGLVEVKTASIKEHYEQALANIRTENEALKAEVAWLKSEGTQKDLTSQVRDAMNAAGVYAEGAEEFVVGKALGMIKLTDDGKVQIMKDGDAMFSRADTSKDMGVEEFIKDVMPKIVPVLTKKGSGAGANGSGENTDNGDNPFMDRTKMAEQAKMRNENPALAKKLAQAARDAGKGKSIRVSGV